MFERLKDGKSSLYKSTDRKNVDHQEEKHLNSTFKEIIAMNKEKQKEGIHLQKDLKEYKLKLNKSYQEFNKIALSSAQPIEEENSEKARIMRNNPKHNKTLMSFSQPPEEVEKPDPNVMRFNPLT